MESRGDEFSLSGTGYEDVRQAWNHYLANDNKGRGFVLIGHSQGAAVLVQLVRSEIDGKPIQSRLVSAILAGTIPALEVPRGKDVGGTFKHVPLCRSASQTGCAIVYASYRWKPVPESFTLFGTVVNPAMAAACTSPAALGGSGELHAYLQQRQRDGAQRVIQPVAEGMGHAWNAGRHTGR